MVLILVLQQVRLDREKRMVWLNSIHKRLIGKLLIYLKPSQFVSLTACRDLLRLGLDCQRLLLVVLKVINTLLE